MVVSRQAWEGKKEGDIMTTRDGIGAPRKREIVERDQIVLDLIRTRAEEDKCTRLEDVRRTLGDGLSRSQAYYVLCRLRDNGLIERRAGYIWCLVDDA